MKYTIIVVTNFEETSLGSVEAETPMRALVDTAERRYGRGQWVLKSDQTVYGCHANNLANTESLEVH